MEPKYTEEDLKDHIGIAAVIKDELGKILVQDHVKYGFWTIPVGKALQHQNAKDALVQELAEECGITVKSAKLLTTRDYSYERKGKTVRLTAHLFEIESFEGTVVNNEPQKHRTQQFMSIEGVKKLPYLSDLTLLYLETLGIIRAAKIA